MNKNSTEDALTETIIQLIEDKKPRNIQQLVNLAKEKTSIPGQKIVEHIMQLQSQVKITGSIYKNLCKEARKLPNICSSIAIALTRATGKPIIIEKTELSEDSKTIEAYYKILGTTKNKLK